MSRSLVTPTIDFRQERLDRGLTEGGMALQVGVPKHVWRQAERGRPVHPRNQKLIADFFGLRVTQVWPHTLNGKA